MVNWKKSNLKKGQRLKIQEDILVTRNSKRFIKAIYEGETKYGIMLRLFFEPGPQTEDDIWDYRYFVNWPSIFCGDIKLQTETGENIKAVRLFK